MCSCVYERFVHQKESAADAREAWTLESGRVQPQQRFLSRILHHIKFKSSLMPMPLATKLPFSPSSKINRHGVARPLLAMTVGLFF